MRSASAARQLCAGRRVQQRLPDGLEPARQLVGVDALEPFEHDGAAPLPILDHQRADFGERRARHARPLAQLVDEVERDVELAHGAERLRQAADLALRLARLGVLEPLGQHRQRLAQAPRGDARLVDADVLAGDGGGELSPQRARAALEEADQG